MNSSVRGNAMVVDGRGGRPTIPVLRFILSCVLLMTPMGSLLCFGRLQSVLAHYIGHKNHTDPPDVTPVIVCAWVVFPFSVFAFAHLVMKVSYPRMIVFCGCGIGSISLAIASVQTTLSGMTFFYGILQGVACGAYAIPLVYISQCFPHTLGVMMGFATCTFAAGELLGVYVFGQLLGLSELPTSLATAIDYDVFKKIPVMFRGYAMIYFTSTLIGTLLLPDPKEVMLRVRLHGLLDVQAPKPKQEHLGDIQAVVRTAKHYHTLARKKVYILILPMMTMTMAACGSLVIQNVSKVGFKVNNLSQDSVTAAETWATLSGVVGRLVWGIIADAVGYHVTMAVIGILCGSLYFSLTYIKIAGFFQLWTCIMAFMFAGNFATIPTAVTELFGSQHFSTYFPIAYLGLAIGVAISYGQSANFVEDFSDGTRTSVVTLSFVVGFVNLLIFPLRYLRFSDPGYSQTNHSNPTSSKAVSSSGLVQHSSADVSQRNLRSCSSLNSSNDLMPPVDPSPLFAPNNRQFSALPETSLTSLPSISNCHRKFSTLPRSPSPSVDSPPPSSHHTVRMPTTISPPQA